MNTLTAKLDMPPMPVGLVDTVLLALDSYIEDMCQATEESTTVEDFKLSHEELRNAEDAHASIVDRSKLQGYNHTCSID